MNEQITYLKNLREPDKKCLITLYEAFDQIKSNNIFINKLRIMPQPSSEYDELKLLQPAVQWNQVPGLMYFDYDLKGKDKSEIDLLGEKLRNISFVYSCWLSIGGQGHGLLVKYKMEKGRILPILPDWKKLYNQIKEKLDLITGFISDKRCCDIKKNNFLSSDFNLYINENSEVLPQINEGATCGLKRNIVEDTTCCTLVVNEKPEQIYQRSFIDVHFPDLLKEALIVNKKLGYAIFEDKQNVVKILTPWRKIKNGDRNRILMFVFILYYRINHMLGDDRTWKWLYQFNQDFCNEPLRDGEMRNIFNHVLLGYKNGTIYKSSNKVALVHFFSDCKLDKESKLSIIQQSRVIISKHKIKIAIDKLIFENQKLTVSKVAISSKVGERTVQKYWLEFLPEEKRNSVIQYREKYNKKEKNVVSN